ncbi:sigma 54-interacting transcriptional regulator [Pirellulaceae bacterium SH467]
MQQNNSSAYLIIRQGSRWTDVFRLEPGRPLIVGRASSNEIPVADDRSSRRHAEIFFDNGWYVRDLGSRNGTLVDGRKIEQSQLLMPGSTIAVASCKMTFTNSLEEVAPPLEVEGAGPESTREGGIEVSRIIHRQSKSAILDPEAFQQVIRKDRVGEPMASLAAPIAPAIALLQLAFELARENNLFRGCERALERLLDETQCQSAGILKIESSETGVAERKVLAAVQRSGKAYHPVSDSLAASVLREGNALLARNIHDSELAGGVSQSTPMANSQVHATSSAILAPIREGSECVGFVHLYSRVGEPDLAPEHLEVALAIADVVGTFFANIQKQLQLESKLKTSRNRINELEQQLGHSEEWVSSSHAMDRLREQVARVGPTSATVLLRGESGSGKELVARSIHDASHRAAGPFVAINCAALTPTLLESELFGHEKGAFTGATERKLGKFEQAHQGTLMLDELGEMSLEIQAKFLRVLEGKPFERVGGSKPIQVDVRVVAATNKDLEKAVADGSFRSDLYFRLRVIELRIPSLRERPDDILPIAEHFLAQFRSKSGHGPEGFSDRARAAMRAYHWPGNVRELRNAVERAFVLCNGVLADPEDLALSHLQIPGIPALGGQSAANQPAGYQERTLEEIEMEHIAATLEYTGGQKNRAAAILGIERSTLDRKIKRQKSDTP